MSEATPSQSTSVSLAVDETRPWRRAALWLLFLGPFFFTSYGIANWLASQHAHLPSIVFEWEKQIPFVPWTILPYWSIDLMYAASLFICRTRHEVDAHAKRLLAAQIVAVTCFIVFPLRFGFDRPLPSGLSGDLFTLLSSFDQPFNQAPSLHIALLVILWALYVRHIPSVLVWPFHVLCASIAVSVLTTFQHHFIDIPSGALLGCLCVWCWPLQGDSLFQSARLTHSPGAVRIAVYYLLGAAAFSGLAWFLGGWGWWLLWPAVSLTLVALNYLVFGAAGFQKSEQGHLSRVVKWLYAPYLLAAKINSRYWTRGQAKYVAITDNVYLGRMPSKADLNQAAFYAVVDMSAEFDKPDSKVIWRAFPHLDLLPPSSTGLRQAASSIESLSKHGKVLVVCALGYSRSALALLAWLLLYDKVATLDEALALLKTKRKSIVISDRAQSVLSLLKEEKSA